MNKTVKGILSGIRVLLSVAVMTGILFGSYTYLNKVFRNREFENVGAYFRNIPEDSMDVITMGSSHAEYSFIPSVFYEETGLYSYTYASACQPYEVAVEMLEEVYKRQNPKLLIFEVFTAMPLRSACDNDSCYVFAQYKVTGKERYDIIDYLPEDKRMEYYNEFLNYHNDWKTAESPAILLPENALATNTELDPYSGYLYVDGYDYYPSNWWHASKFEGNMDVQLDTIDLECLNKLYEMCTEHGTKMLLYKTPIDGMDEENQSYLNQVWKWADEHGVPYIDMIDKSKELGYYMWIHSDSYHANVTGAEIVTDYLAQYVKNMGISFDHKENEVLTPMHRHTAEKITAFYMRYEHHALKYTKVLSHTLSGYYFLRYFPLGGFNEDLLNNIRNMGFYDFDPEQPYYGIVHDGSLIASSHDSASAWINDGEFTVNGTAVYDKGDPVSDPESFMSLVYYTNDFQDRTVKEIEYRWGGYDRGFAEYDWDHE